MNVAVFRVIRTGQISGANNEALNSSASPSLPCSAPLLGEFLLLSDDLASFPSFCGSASLLVLVLFAGGTTPLSCTGLPTGWGGGGRQLGARLVLL